MSDNSMPRFLQGFFAFDGKGLRFTVSARRVAALRRPAGAIDPAGLFPRRQLHRRDDHRGADARRRRRCGTSRSPPKDATHVSLRVVEDLLADTVLELYIAAPDGLSGTVVIDLGLVEI